MADQDYMIEYEQFQKEFKLGETSPDKVGEVIMRLAGYYGRYNLIYAEKLRAFSAVMAKLINSTDDQSGKGMTASKAEILGKDTSESGEYDLAKVHINNIQEYINSLKSLQRSLMIEYGNTQ
jgi:hypothetical protein